MDDYTIEELRELFLERDADIVEIPIDALLTIEVIAPLIAIDKIGNVDTWLKAWDEVGPWLARLNMRRCLHEYESKNVGSPMEPRETVGVCKYCGHVYGEPI